MSAATPISWCDRTWSPWIGCTKVSPACDGCYAEHLMDTRLGRVEWGPHGERRRTSAGYWRQLAKWDREAEALGRPLTVFPSLCDPFDNQVPVEWRRDHFAAIRDTPHLVHLLLTKRPQNIVRMVEAAGGLPRNAALGATCEDQTRAGLNLPYLIKAKRVLGPAFTFVSCEPLLGRVDLWLWLDPLNLFVNRLDWVITGGETDQGSHKARPTHPDWFRSLRDQCAAAGVPFHHKQNGEWDDVERYASETVEDFDVRGLTADGVIRVGKRAAGRLLDGVTHDATPALGRGGVA